jgi:hypothetical protein
MRIVAEPRVKRAGTGEMGHGDVNMGVWGKHGVGGDVPVNEVQLDADNQLDIVQCHV